MEKPFDFEMVGKKMPYSVPENFFDTLEENLKTVVLETNTTQTPTIRKNSHRKWIYMVSGAVAAVGLLLFTIRIFLPKQNLSDGSFEQVELAFNQLTPWLYNEPVLQPVVHDSYAVCHHSAPPPPC